MLDYSNTRPLEHDEIDPDAHRDYFLWQAAPWQHPLVLNPRYQGAERLAVLTAIHLGGELAIDNLLAVIGQRARERQQLAEQYELDDAWEDGYTAALLHVSKGGSRMLDEDELKEYRAKRLEAAARLEAQRQAVKDARKAKAAARTRTGPGAATAQADPAS